MTTILINTMNENPAWLKKSIESNYECIGEKQIIVSTMLNDRNYDMLMQYRRRNIIQVNFCDHTKHPGRSPEGAYYQINSASHFIKGEWFYYISSNDYVDKYKIQNEISKCKSEKKQVCYSAFHVIDWNEKIIGERIVGQRWNDYNYQRHIRGNYVSDASFISVDLLKKYIPFRSDLYGNLAHWDLWLRIFEGEGNVFCYNEKKAFYYRNNFDSMHNERKNNINLQTKRQQQEEKLRAYNNRKSKMQ